MDKALWISWYNLPDDGRGAYLAWLHGTYIPAMLERRGFLWAAHYASVEKTRIVSTHPEFITPTTQDGVVPDGDRYILLFAAEDDNVFGAPGAVRPSMLGTLHQSVRQALGNPDTQARFAADGSEVAASGSPTEFKNLVSREIARWEKFVRTSGFNADK